YGGRNGVVHVVDAVTRAELFTQDLETPIDALAFEATGRKLAVGTYDANVVVFDLTTGTRAWDARVGREAITSLRFTGQVLAVPSSDGHVELRSAVDGALVHVLGHDHPSRRAQVAVTRNGGRLLTTDGPYVHVWDPIEGRRLLTYGNDSVTTCAAFDAEGERIVTGSRRGTVLEWRVPARHDPDLWRGTSEQFDAFEYAPDGRIYVAGGVLLRVFDGTTHQEVRNWFGHRSSVHTIRFSADGAYAASGDYAGEVLIWDVAEDRLLHRIQAVRNEGYRAARVAFAADGTVLFTGGTDGVLRKWSVATGELVAEQVVYEGWLSSLVAHEDGGLLVVGDHDGLIRLFDPASLRVQRELAGHKGIATDLAFLPGTRRLVSASWDRTVRIWDTETGETVRTFRALTADSAGMADAYLAVTFLPDATRIAAGSADGSAKLWDVGSGRLVATLRGGQGWMRGARFSPDGERLVTVEGRGIIRRWETRPFRDRLDAIDARADLIRKAEDALVALQTTDADPDAVIEAARAQTGMGPDAHRALIDAAYRARSTPDGLITRAWALFLSRDRARADYDGMLAILDTMRTDAENPRARDPELTTVRMLGAFRRGDARRVVNARGIGDAEGEPTALHAVELAVRSLAHKRLDDAAESKQRLAELEALLREHPALLEARGVRALTAEARKAQR
nr:WD40 repeat domain-containing protein [Planctomycetota bacterium]